MKILSLLLVLPSLALANVFKIYAPARLNSSLVRAYNQEVILDIYKSLHIRAKIIYVTEEEINERLKSGDFDAVVSKIEDEKMIPNSIKISPPLIENFSVYRYKLKETKLKTSSIVAGTIKGVLSNSKGIIKNRSIFKKIKSYNTYTDLMTALEKDEVDSILLSPLVYKNELDKEKANKLEQIPEELAHFSIHHYINKNQTIIVNGLRNQFKKRYREKTLLFSDFAKKYKKRLP